MSFFDRAALVLFVVAFIPYILAIIQGVAKPSIVSWIIWASLDTVYFAAMRDKETVNGQIIGAITGAWIVVIIALKFGQSGWTRKDKIAIVGGAFGVILWALTSNALAAMIVSSVVAIWGSIPTFVSAFQEPGTEDKLAWTIFWLSCVAAIIAVPKWDLAHSLQPLTFFFIETVMMFILFVVPRVKAHLATN